MRELNKIAIFDLDGTLADSIDDLVLAANEARGFYNLPSLPGETVASFVGDGLNLFVERLFKDSSVKLEEAIKTFKERYLIHITDNTRFYPGTAECIEKLRKNGFITGILSNKKERLSKILVKNLGFVHLFDFVYGGDSFEEKKPSPLPIIKILEEFNGNREKCYMVGDSCNDILSGKQAGIKTIEVLYGFNGEKHLKNCKADFSAKKPEDICRIILEKQ